MTTHRTLYTILNQHAKAWWYYKQLRSQGQTEEARKRERDSIRSEVRNLRSALSTPGGHIGLGRGGATVHSNNCQMSGGDPRHYLEVGLLIGIPVIDSRSINDHDIYETVGFPMVAVGREPDPQPWHGFAYAPLEYVASLYLALGATLHNLNIDPVTAKEKLAAFRERKAKVRAEMAAQPKSEPIRKPVVNAEGITIDLQDLADEGADGACLACGEYAYSIEPDATNYTCESCGAKKVMGAENILMIYV